MSLPQGVCGMGGAWLKAAQCPVCDCSPSILSAAPVHCALCKSCLEVEIVPPGLPKVLSLLLPLSFPSFPLSQFHAAWWLARGNSRISSTNNPFWEVWLCPGTLEQEGIHSAAPGGLMQVQPTCFTLPAFDFPSVFCFGSVKGREERWVLV